MAKQNSGFSYKGEIGYDDGRFYVTEIKKDSEETYDLSAMLINYVGRTITINGKEELEINPIEES
ncbi:YonK family protein [Sporosarcina sp. FSL W7-1283]|uniref:YonK family protein n=1 Tax=Sporosarcina sp. FSL W7-1283 TaxID=2921560 RepID=UPI0030F8DA84